MGSKTSKVAGSSITPYVGAHNVIPAHKFGFRQNHGTIEQVNRITSEIRTAFEHRKYCSAIFLDVVRMFSQPGYSQGLARASPNIYKFTVDE